MLLSDDGAWWERADHRRGFCAPDAPWIVVAERGWPCDERPVTNGLPWFERAQRACADYLRATGLVHRPGWVYGIGPRAVWPDAPGRWFVAHGSTREVVEAARAHVAGAAAPNQPGVGHTWISGHATQLVRRAAGEPAPTIGDALAAALAFRGLRPDQCFGAYPQALPVSAQHEDGSVLAVAESGLVISTPLELAGWQDEFSQAGPYPVPPGRGAVGAAGSLTVERLGFAALARRIAAGDTSVPTSPIELAIAFAETVGIKPTDCWSLTEGSAGFTRSERPEDAYAGIIYRRDPGDAVGRAQFLAWAESIGLRAEDLDYGHPEGEVAAARGRFKRFRNAR